MKTLEQISFGEYRNWKGLNATSLPSYLRSPQHYKHNLDNPKDSSAFVVGRALHELVLQPEEYAKNFATAPKVDGRTKDGKEAIAEFKESLEGRDVQILTAAEHEKVINMALSFDKHPTANKLIEGPREISTQFMLENVLCKARADCLLGDDFVVDLKTSRNASPDAFIQAVYNYHYYIQAAFYLKAFNRSEFIFIAIENDPPYSIGIYQCPKEMLEYGAIICGELVKKIYASWAEGKFPGYSSQIELLDTPQWMLSKLEKKGDSLCQQETVN